MLFEPYRQLAAHAVTVGAREVNMAEYMSRPYAEDAYKEMQSLYETMFSKERSRRAR